jgi:hypothetical protein
MSNQSGPESPDTDALSLDGSRFGDDGSSYIGSEEEAYGAPARSEQQGRRRGEQDRQDRGAPIPRKAPTVTVSEQRQVALIKRLEERNRAALEDKAREESRKAAARDKARSASLGVDPARISSRLLQPKKKTLLLLHEQEQQQQQQQQQDQDDEGEYSRRSPKLQGVVRRAQHEGPDPRHAAFLSKLAEERRAREEAEQAQVAKAERARQALAERARANVSKSLAERVAELEQRRAEEAARRQREEEEAAARAPKLSGAPGVWSKHLIKLESNDAARFQQDRSLDRARWAQRQGIPESTPVFYCSAGYPAVRDELLRRGWHENKDKDSDLWDLYYTVKIGIVLGMEPREEQIINRFLGTGELCSKAGISKNLKSVKWFEAADPDAFFPRCYNLADGSELHEFLEDFRVTAAEALLKRVRVAARCAGCGAATPRGCSCALRHEVLASPALVAAAARASSKLVSRFNDDYVDSPSSFVPPVVSVVEWALIRASKNGFLIQIIMSVYKHIKVSISLSGTSFLRLIPAPCRFWSSSS